MLSDNNLPIGLLHASEPWHITRVDIGAAREAAHAAAKRRPKRPSRPACRTAPFTREDRREGSIRPVDYDNLPYDPRRSTDLPPVFGPGGLANRADLCGRAAIGQDGGVPVGGRYPGGAGAKRRTGGQTAEQSTTPGREVGRRAWCVPQLRCGVEHGASLRGHAATWVWAASQAAGDR